METPAQEIIRYINKEKKETFPTYRTLINHITDTLEIEEKQLCRHIAIMMREKDSDGSYIYMNFEEAWKAMFNLNVDAPWA